ncbi:MAG: GWxTD domain-containing protein, partial [Acidobacteria bacterium]|nr:GWxTD domain-containing protein [Acidobacteriota bacterium]
EPERLTALAGEAGRAEDDPIETARLQRASALVNDGKSAVALAELGPAGEHDSLRLRYARVLLTLHADRELQFPKLRANLAVILRADPLFRDAFDVWLGLNPSKPELVAYLAELKSRSGPVAAWQRAEVQLRLGDAREAVHALEGIGESDRGVFSRADRVVARARFQLKEDDAGQAVYYGLLDRLDETTASLLFRDIAAIASAAERQEFASLGLEAKAAFFRRFWTARHPVPVQEQNPRLAEHYRRLAQALNDYTLQSNGRGYFTDLEVFRSFSPKLPYFDSKIVFDDGQASRYWLDPRGLLLVRHGESERQFGRRHVAGTEPAESWLISRYRSRPLLYHFVKRAPVGEWTLALNLAVAATRNAAASDDPEKILPELSPSVVPLYESRQTLHSIYQQVRDAQSLSDFGRLLRDESELTAAFVTAALAFDSTGYYTKDNTLPLAVSVVNLYAGGKPAIEVHFEADLSELDVRKLGEAPSLHATVMLYDRDWATLRQREQKTFPLQPPVGGKFKGFLGGVLLTDLEPEEYRLTLVVSQPDSGRVGLARGGHEVTYVPDRSLGVSDLVLLRQPRAKSKKGTDQTDTSAPWFPAPQRVVSDDAPIAIEFELYNVQPDEFGQARYEVEERILTLYEEPGFFGKLANYANLAGQMFFPLYTFAGQVGTMVVSQATASETDGLTMEKRVVEEAPASTINEKVRVDLQTLKPGVYTVYVTVRDLHTREVVSRFLTFQVA